MQTWGFSIHDLEIAARFASARIGENTQLELRDMGTRGRATKFLLRFASPTSRLLKREQTNDAEYPPGVLVRDGAGKRKTFVDPVPLSEVFPEGKRVRVEYTPTRRSCGAPCWHAFGHFFRCLFEINPEGRVKTALADYRGMEGFEQAFPRTDRNIGSAFQPAQYSDSCECYHYGCEDF